MANKRVDITGKVFGILTAIRPTKPNKNGQWLWLYECKCGNFIEQMVFRRSHKNAGANGCGCTHHRESGHDYYKTHKKLTWVHTAIKQRCLNSSSKDYPHYGGRGIRICEEWINVKEFCDWAVSTGYKDGLTIERKDVNGDYRPENCTWISNDFQVRNRTMSKIYEYNGLKGDARFWSEYSGIKYNTLRGRLHNYGWSIEKAINTPIGRWAEQNEVT